MKKHGYTLTEVLISVGIIGVLAAVMLPMMNKFKPDPIKAKWVKTYDSINKVLPVLQIEMFTLFSTKAKKAGIKFFRITNILYLT